MVMNTTLDMSSLSIPVIPLVFWIKLLYRVKSQDSAGSEYRALVSLPAESYELTLYMYLTQSRPT